MPVFTEFAEDEPKVNDAANDYAAKLDELIASGELTQARDMAAKLAKAYRWLDPQKRFEDLLATVDEQLKQPAGS